MSLEAVDITLQIFWPVLVAAAGVAGSFLAVLALVDGFNSLIERFKK